MYGQRQIFTCLGIVALVTLLNFYRSAIRRDREHRRYADLNRRERLQQEALERHVRFRSHWLEYEDRCWDVHALVHRPESTAAADIMPTGESLANLISMDQQQQRIDADDDRSDGQIDAGPVSCSSAEQKNDNTIRTASSTVRTATLRKPDAASSEGSTSTTATPATTEATAGVVYVAVFILLVSLGKAAYDLSKQFKEAQQSRTLSEDEMLRRCSLQEYSLIKHRQKKQQLLQDGQQQQQAATKATPHRPSAALEPFFKKCGGLSSVSQPSTMNQSSSSLASPPFVTQLSVDSGADKTRQQHGDFVRRMSTNPQDYSNGSGIPTEPGTPVKAGKLIAGRPAPLLRRCSVPVSLNTSCTLARRPSMDAFSEDELSAGQQGIGQGESTKRRVRMIHRH